MILSVSICPRTLLNDCNYSAMTMFWRSAIPSIRKKMPLVLKHKRDSVDHPGPREHEYTRQATVRPRELAQTAPSTLRDFDCGRYRYRPLKTIAISAKHERGSVDNRRLGQQHDIPQPTVRAPQLAQTAADPMPNAKGTRPVTMVAPPQTFADHGRAQHRRQRCPPHLSRISLHFGCISQTITFSKASHDRPAGVVICESR